MSTQPRIVRAARARALALAAAVAATTLAPGCAQMNERRNGVPRFGELPSGVAPPDSAGATVRSQDARRLGRRNPQGGEPVVTSPSRARDDSGEIAWSGPRRSPSYTPLAGAAEPRIAPLPAPPVLPAEIVAPTPPAGPPRTTLASAAQPEPPSLEAPATIEEPPAQPAAPPTIAAATPAPVDSVTAIRGLVGSALQKIGPVRSYQARMVRQERVGESLLPEEELLLSVRREPFAVRLEWPNGSTPGREVLYSAVETGGKMQIRQPGSIVPRITLAPDSPLVRKNSRHPITEAGFDELLRNLDASAAGVASGQIASRMTLEGPVELAEVGRACHRITEVRANGETWIVGLDAESLLPVFVQGTDAAGNLLESYRFSDVRFDVAELASAEAFDPEKRWGGGGLLGRIARSPEGDAANAKSTR